MALVGLAYIHDFLYKEQERLGRPLTTDEALVKMQMTPGYSYPSGTTIEDVYKQLEESRLIARSEKYLLVKEFAQTQPKCTEQPEDDRIDPRYESNPADQLLENHSRHH